MRWAKYLYVGLGVVLLIWIVGSTDVRLAADHAMRIGWGMAAVLLIYLSAFYVDSVTWHLALVGLPFDWTWSYRTWRIRMVGEAFNMVLPAGGFGGEPIKAVLLNRHHAVTYREGTTSLILAKTINLIALIAFLLIGLWLLADNPRIPPGYGGFALGGFCFLAFGVSLLFLAQRYRGTSAMGRLLGRTRLGGSVDRVIHHVADVEDRLGHFYLGRPARFIPALALAFFNWVLGVLEVYVVLHLLGHPISFADAWIIESVTQMVRAATFFIPANLGTQDGAFVILCSLLTGQPEIGVAVAAIRRVRELVFVVWGFGLGGMYSLRALAAGKGAE